MKYTAKNDSSAKDRRAFVSNRFELELDGVAVGVLTSVDGGNFKAEPIGEQVGGEGLVTRYPGRLKYDDITLQTGTHMAPQFWKIIKATLDGTPTRLNGAIVTRDYDFNSRVRREFQNALIAEIGFPALDAKASQPNQLTVKISPETMKYVHKKEGPPPTGDGKNAVPQKKSTPHNFRFRLDNFEKPCATVSKIDAFAVKQNIINNPLGGFLYPKREVGRIEHPTFSVTVPEVDAAPWVTWWKTFVGDGEHGSKGEKTGSITYLNSSLADEIIILHLAGVGISGITFDKHDAGADTIRNIKVDLYMESLTLEEKNANSST